MTWEEIREVLDDDGILTFCDNDGNSFYYEPLFYPNIHPYQFHVLMMPVDTKTYGDDEILYVKFQQDLTKGFLFDDYQAVVDTDPHTNKQLLSLYNAWNEAVNTGKVVYSKVLTPEEDRMMEDPNSKKELTVYACFPDGEISTVIFNRILYVPLDRLIYYLALNDNNDVLPFMLSRDGEDDNLIYIKQTSVDVGNAMMEKLSRTHIVGGKENFDILLEDNKHYHMRLREGDELVEYKRLYSFKYDGQLYVYFRNIKTDLRRCFKHENVLGQHRVVRIDDRRKSEEIFWNHPFHYRVTNVNNLLHSYECTFSRSFGNEKEVVYVVDKIVYRGNHCFALATKEEKNKTYGDIDVKIYWLAHPRGEPWLYPVENEDEEKNIIDRMNDRNGN